MNNYYLFNDNELGTIENIIIKKHSNNRGELVDKCLVLEFKNRNQTYAGSRRDFLHLIRNSPYLHKCEELLGMK